MLKLEFVLDELTTPEARGLQALLNEMFGARTQPVADRPLNIREKIVVEAPVACPVLPLAEQLEVIELKSEEVKEELPAILKPEPPLVEQEPERKKLGRPKGAKDKIKSEVAQEPVDPPQLSGSLSAATASTASTAPDTSAPPTLDEIREALQVYSEKHGMKAAIGLVGEFGCARASEIQGIDVAEQLHFIKLAKGA